MNKKQNQGASLDYRMRKYLPKKRRLLKVKMG